MKTIVTVTWCINQMEIRNFDSYFDAIAWVNKRIHEEKRIPITTNFLYTDKMTPVITG
jgi:hypothetical protein